MTTNAQPYKIKEEHEEIIKVDPSQAGLSAGEYHKVAGGVIVPQVTPTGGTMYEGKQEITIQEVEMPAEGDTVTKKVGVFNKKDSETPSESIAPSELVASVSQSPKGSPPKRKLIKVTLDSPLFGKVTIPVVESLPGDKCVVLVTDSSDGFSFVPPVSETPFTVTFEGNKKETKMCYCGQTFTRPSLKEQYLLLVHAE